jgi:phage terminase large subunit
MDSGKSRAWLCWHRRAGKDEASMHVTAMKALDTPGNYWHCLPEYAQARKAIWEAVNPHSGRRRIDEAFPPAIRRKTREDEMFIELANGSTWRMVGSDRVDSLVGAGPAGIVFSEYALSDPAAWDYMRPMLLESGGWAIFNSTVRGRNHFWKLGELAKHDPAWFYSLLPATDTGVFTPEQLDQERRELCALHGDEEGMARFRQEYLNDPDVALPGAYYASILSRLDQQGQITDVPYEPTAPVVLAWDLGFGDSTAIWFVQQVGLQVRVIDYLEMNGVTIDGFAKLLQQKPYAYHESILPHDAASGHINGASVADQLRAMGFRIGNKVTGAGGVLPRDDIDGGIHAVRSFLSRCWFDRTRCARGLEALRGYHREWDDKAKMFKPKPKHDWTSHGADAFRYLALGYRPPVDRGPRQAYAISD